MQRRFSSAREAVVAGLTLVNPVSVARNAEYAFYVFAGADGFRVGPLRVGEVGAYTNTGLEPPTSLDPAPVAVAHTHAAAVSNRQGCASCVNTERFSGPDRAFAEKHGLTIYVATPGGTFGELDPATGKSTYERNVMPVSGPLAPLE